MKITRISDKISFACQPIRPLFKGKKTTEKTEEVTKLTDPLPPQDSGKNLFKKV